MLDFNINTSFFKQLKNQLPGVDGGNIRAKLWFSGLEWAGGDEAITLDVTRPVVDIDGLKVPYLSEEWKLANPNFYKWQFDQKIAKIICKAIDFESGYKKYMKDSYCNFDSNEFKLNLFPLPCKNISAWSDAHIELTKTKIKYHYQTYCSGTRFKLLSALVKKFEPKVIVCFGQRYLEEYKIAFWDCNQNSVNYREVLAPVGVKNTLKILIADGLPILIIAPFLGRNLVANAELDLVGETIKKYL